MDKLIYNEVIKTRNLELAKQIKNEDLRIQALIMTNICDQKRLINELLHIENDDIKVKYIYFIKHDSDRTEILKTINNDKLKIESLNKVFTNYFKGEILKTVKNEGLLMEYYEKADPFVQFLILTGIKNDSIKIMHLYEFALRDQAEIIKTLNDDYKLLFLKMKEYNKYKIDILCTMKNEQIIIDYYNKVDNITEKLKLINLVDNKNLKSYFVENLDESIYKYIYNTNKKECKENIIKNTKIDNINYDIDPSLTFGVELEACNDDSKNLLYINRIINNWKITEDASLKNGLEIVSPILKYDKNNLKQLKYICDFMKANNFFTNDKCGGHIHFGFDYLNNIDQINRLLNIYTNCEDIFYAICNKPGSKSRDDIDVYAKKMDVIAYRISNVNKEKISSLNEYTKIIKKIPGSRYYGLNLKNIGNKNKNTLEFRIPNGEIEFKQLISNIRLFAKLLEKSKDLGNNKYEYNILLNNKLSERERLYLLLDLLFETDEDKKIFKKRYRKNTNIIKIFKKTQPIKI